MLPTRVPTTSVFEKALVVETPKWKDIVDNHHLWQPFTGSKTSSRPSLALGFVTPVSCAIIHNYNCYFFLVSENGYNIITVAIFEVCHYHVHYRPCNALNIIRITLRSSALYSPVAMRCVESGLTRFRILCKRKAPIRIGQSTSIGGLNPD